MELEEQYGVSSFDVKLCSIVRTIIGTNNCPKWLQRRSAKKYHWGDNLYRYWLAKYCKLPVGRYTYGYAPLVNLEVASIGAFCSIGNNVTIVPNNHRFDYVTSSPIVDFEDFGFVKGNGQELRPQVKPVIIGNDVWIGEGAIIFQGVHIGNGAVIGAGSIIRKDVPPYAIVVGVDKLVKYRFDKETIAKLQEIEWWQWSDEKIKEHIAKFTDIKKFCKEFGKA